MKVFLVEDALPLRQRIKRTVEEAGGQVIGEASSEYEAVASILALHPDMIVVDLRLSQGSGVEVLRRTKAANPATVAVVLTNCGREQYQSICIAAGADFYLEKGGDYPGFENLMQQLAGITC
jgi:DNA-binding NarL/FixJ family response regulator